jgi:hypothetical protein
MAATQIRGNTQIKAGTITNAEISASANIALSKLAEAVIQADGGQAFTADQSMGGNKLTSVGAPSASDDVATKGYVDGLVTGLSWKDTVRAATTANITLSAPQTIDGVSVIAGDRVLVKNQTAPEDNGIYVVAAGAWTRALDADAADELLGAAVFVSEGSTYGNSVWTMTTDAPITVGTTGLVWTQFGAGSLPTAGAGLLLTGSVIDVQTADTSITVNADSIQVNLNGTGGLEVSSGVRIKLADTSLATGAGGAQVNLASNGGLEVSSGLKVKFDGTSISVGASGIKVNLAKFITRETPSGTVNGTNDTFTLAATPASGSEEVFLNGLLQEGGGEDYTLTTNSIQFVSPPASGDRIRVNYRVA